MLKITVGCFVLLFLTMGIISIPYVQTMIIQKLTTSIFDKIDHEVSIDYINISWFDTILLRNVRIKDTQNRTMVNVERIILDFKIIELIGENSINFDKAILVGPDMDMRRNAPDNQFNFTYFIDRIKQDLSREDPRGTAFVIDDVVLKNGEYQLFSSDKELITNRFDHYHFILQGLDAQLGSFLIKPGHISFQVKNLQCIDSASGLNVSGLETRFIFTRKSMVFQNMTASFGKSTISQSMVFNYLQPSSLKYFEDSVNITSNIKSSLLHSSDLGQFVPSVKKYEQYYRVKGFIEGPVHRFNANNLNIEFGGSSRLEGYISLYGMPNLKETFINAKINTATFNVEDLAPYMDQASLDRAMKFGVVHFDGRFSGFLNDFVSNGVFDTDLGHIETDINLKIKTKEQGLSTYSGRLMTRDFDLGQFLADTATYQMLDLNGQIKGMGFTKENAQFTLKSKIDRLGIKKYNYQNIRTDAAMADQFFNGQLIIDDPNLKFQADASIDLTDNRDIIQINARLDTALLQPLNISEEHAFVKSYLYVDMTGLELDKLLGSISLNDTYIEYEDRNVYLDTLRIISEKDSISRSLKIRSPNLRAHLFGDYNYSAFFRDVAGAFTEYQLLFKNDSVRIQEFYANKTKTLSDYYYLDYDIELTNFNPLINLFVPDIFFAENTMVTGSFTGGPTSIIQINTELSRFDYDRFSFRDNVVNINSTKLSDTTIVYADYFISSERQYYDNEPRSEQLMVEVDWKENHLDFLSIIHQYQQNNYAKISGEIDFLANKTQVSLHPSELLLIDKYWKFSPDNRIILKHRDIEFINLFLEHDDQNIAFNGSISENPDDNLFVAIKNFEIENVNPLIKKELRGTINGFFDLRNYFFEREINSRISLRDFKVNEFLIGDILANSNYENFSKRFKVETTVNRLGTETINIDGYLVPSAEENQLILAGSFNKANLDIVEPFLEGIVTDIQGYLQGDIQILGRFNYPIIKGTGVIEDGSLLFNYLNTPFKVDGVVTFVQDTIIVDQLILRDPADHTGIIHGTAIHKGFKEVAYDFTGEMEKLLVLNTSSAQNEFYYGTAYGTGQIRIYGKQKNMFIDANAKTEKGTKIFIPLEGSSEVVQEEFITFLSHKSEKSLDPDDMDQKTDIIGAVNLEGINLNMDLDITPDAYMEIIFDLTAGDIIRGRGNGKIKLQVDTKGDFLMFGDYEIEEGGYNFTMYNIINKEFEILPGSHISWTGDPYAANLDIQAIYRQMASLTPILKIDKEEADANPEVSRKYPAFVELDIQNDLRYPEIDFDIELEDYPKNAVVNGISLETQWTAFKNKLNSDEQELKRQVFSLIILKNFSAEDAFNVGGSVGRSVSEFISNQISYWITQFDENLVIDVDLGDLDQEAFNTFQLRMSYSFMDGRLRVTRDGGFTDQNSNADVASVLGDWSVEYLLTPDGKYRAKIYNKTNFNTLNPNYRSTSTTTGFSLMHTQSFDEVRELFNNARKKSRQKQDQAPRDDPSGISKRTDNE